MTTVDSFPARNTPASNFYVILQNAAVANGNGTDMQVGGLSAVGFQVGGLVSGAAITFKGSIDGVTFTNIQVSNFTDGVITTSAAEDGLYVAPVAGLSLVRSVLAGWVSGSVTVTAVGTASGQPSLADVSITGSSAVTIANGADIAEGSTTDAAVTTNTTGTVSGKLRGLVAILADVWSDAQNALQVMGNIASGSADSGSPVKVGGKYNASAPTLSDGNRGDLQLDINANLKNREQYAPVAEDNTNGVYAIAKKPAAASAYSGTAFAVFLTDVDVSVKVSAGNILSLYASNINAAVRYIQVFNKASAPANPDVPIFSFPMPAGTAIAPSSVQIGEEFFGTSGYYLSTGIAIGVSTTAATFTGATTTDHIEQGTYV